MIENADLQKFSEGAWKVASAELKKGFNLVGGSEMTSALQDFASTRINELVEISGEYGLEKPVKLILNRLYEKRLKSKLDAFEILTYPSKMAVSGKNSKTAFSKEVVAKCPVYIYVYNSADTLVGKFVNDEPEITGDNVDMWTVGAEKHIRLYDDTYSLKYVSTGTGVMQLTVYDYAGSMDAVRACTYVDVPLQEGLDYDQGIEEELLVDEKTYDLHSQGETVAADDVSYDFGGVKSGICGDNLTWSLEEDGTLKIAGFGDMYDYSINQRSDYRGPDIRIAEVGENITEIGKEAFAGCSGLTEIFFIGGQPKFGENCFKGLTATVHFPASWGTQPDSSFGGNITWDKEKTDISGFTVSLDGEHIYNGHEIEQTVTVRNGETDLVENEDFTVSYQNNVNAGTATIIITGTGEYTGTVTKEFTIEKAEQVLSADGLTINVGSSVKVSVRGAEGRLSYRSEDPAVAEAAADGTVTGVSEGTTKLTIKAAQTTNYNAAEDIEITVKVVRNLGKTIRGDMFNLANNVKVTWKEVPGAKYYKVYREGITNTMESQSEPVIVTTGLVGWDKQPGLTNGHAYKYRIVASLTGKGDPSGDSTLSYSKVMYRLKTVVIRSVKNTAPGKVTVKYDKTTSGDSYVLQYCERQDMVGAKTKVVLGASKTSYTIGGLKKGKTYYISIRVRKKVNGIDYYTTFGVPKKIKITN